MSSHVLTLPPAAPVVLEYGHAGSPVRVVPRWMRTLWVLLTLPLAITPFVPFTYGVSPAFVVAEFTRLMTRGAQDEGMFLILLAFPFFLGIVIALRRLRLLIQPNPTRSERVVAFSLAGVAALMTFGFFVLTLSWLLRGNGNAEAVILSGIGPTVILVASVLVWWLRRKRADMESLVTVVMHAAYLGNACVCLVAFRDNPDVGWWMTLAMGTVMVTHFIWMLVCSVVKGSFADRR